MPVDTPPPTPLTATADKQGNEEALLHPDHHITSDDPHHPANHIPKLCAHFYTLGWVTGTGGGTSIKHGGKIYIAPSGVQKELMKPSDIFVLHDEEGAATTTTATTTDDTDSPKKRPRKAKGVDSARTIAPVAGVKRKRVSHHDLPYLRAPKQHRPSACTPLFLAAFRLRGAHCCIHTHSQWAVLVTLLLEKSPNPDVFEIERLEQIKGIPMGRGKPGNLGFYDRLRLPVIENKAREEDLTESLEAAMEEYPDSYAVLVRRHGIYVWGEDVSKAKTVCESLDYIFQLAVEMRKLGLAWTLD